jgi:PIN domain nuclease of toxin-antitoxin system
MNPHLQSPGHGGKERLQRLEVAYNYDQLRPSMHFVSQITSALFILMAVIKTGYVNEAMQHSPRITGAIIFFICVLIARFVESKIASALDSFAFVAVRFRENWIQPVLGALVVIPIAFISAVTSYSGVVGNIDQKDLGIDAIQANMRNAASIKTESAKSLKQDMTEYSKQREILRKSIQSQEESAKEIAKKECYAAYPGDKEQISQCLKLKRAAIEDEFLEQYKAFDQQTRRALDDKEALVTKANEDGHAHSEKLIKLMNQDIDNKGAHIAWIAKIVGNIAVWCEVFALILGLLVHYQCYKFNISVWDMRKDAIDYIAENEKNGKKKRARFFSFGSK